MRTSVCVKGILHVRSVDVLHEGVAEDHVDLASETLLQTWRKALESPHADGDRDVDAADGFREVVHTRQVERVDWEFLATAPVYVRTP